MQLIDLDISVLQAVLNVIEKTVPAVEVVDAADFSSAGKEQLMFNAGRRSIVRDFQNAINAKKLKESTNGRR